MPYQPKKLYGNPKTVLPPEIKPHARLILKKLRNELNVSPQVLSEGIGVSPSSTRKWMNDGQYPDKYSYVKLVNFYNALISHLPSQEDHLSNMPSLSNQVSSDIQVRQQGAKSLPTGFH
jgi:hypothetical protein